MSWENTYLHIYLSAYYSKWIDAYLPISIHLQQIDKECISWGNANLSASLVGMDGCLSTFPLSISIHLQ